MFTPPPIQNYALKGPQVDPGASYWMFCSQLHAVTIQELTQLTENPASKAFFPAPPNAAVTAKEFDELLELARWRDDPCRLVNAEPCKDAELTPCKSQKNLPQAYGCRRPISKLLNLAPPLLGAVVVNRFPGEQIIRTGRGMARAVEAETPGIFHRHALNFLISTRSWSPPFQALVWAALDVATASALQAAWYFKWINKRTAFRERPVEYEELCDETKMPPTREQLEQEAEHRQRACTSPINPEPLPPVKLPKQCPPPEPGKRRHDASRSVQRGAR